MIKTKKLDNASIADVLDTIADLLETKGANPFRIRAYRNGAQRVRSTEESLAQLVEENKMDAVKDLPHKSQRLGGDLL